MGLVVIGGTVAILAAATWWWMRRRSDRAIVYWIRGWLLAFFGAAIYTLGGNAAWTVGVLQLISAYFPVLLLAGTVAYAHRPVPVWLLPLALFLAVLRCSLIMTGYRELEFGVALATEPVAMIASAVLAYGVARGARTGSARRLLAPGFIGLAAIEIAISVSGLSDAKFDTPILIAWVLLAPAVVLVQFAVAREVAVDRRLGVERELSESHQRFQALTENSFELIAEMDQDGRFTYTNPRYSECFPSQVSGLIGSSALDLVHPDDHERTSAWFRRSRGGSEQPLLTIRMMHETAGWRWVECSSRLFRAGDKPRLVVTSRDVTGRIELERKLQKANDQLEENVRDRTAQLHGAVADLEDEIAERRRVELQLRNSEQRWRDVSDLSSDLSFAITRAADGSFSTDWVTKAVTRISGRTREEIDAGGWASVIHADDVASVLGNLSRIADGETCEFDGRVVTPIGKARWMRTRIHGVGVDAEGGLRILGAARDVTEARKIMEQRIELEAHTREAQKLESLGVLAGGVAHDFNNVLAVILGNDALAMSDARAGSKLAKQLQRIRDAAKHGQALTNQMLTYSGKASVSLKPLDMYQLVEEMREFLEAAISKNCRLEIQRHNEPTVVAGDPTQLRQVIMNLVTNASESLQNEPGLVTLRCGVMTASEDYLKDTIGTAGLEAGPYVFFEVSDPGEGIDEQVRKRIFEPFFTTKFTGRGLGLASVLGIVRGHSGALKLVTQPQCGTRFRVLIPPATETAVQPSLPLTSRTPRTAKPRVLVVDDDAAVVEVASEFLRRAGNDVVTADGGRKALELLRSVEGGEIDAVVLDLSMPDLDGCETLQEIRRFCPDLPVVIASGFDERSGSDRVPDSEIAAFVRKPFEPEDLVEAVRNALPD